MGGETVNNLQILGCELHQNASGGRAPSRYYGEEREGKERLGIGKEGKGMEKGKAGKEGRERGDWRVELRRSREVKGKGVGEWR